MFSAATAPEFFPARRGRPRRRYPLVRRDPRRFARGITRLRAAPQPPEKAKADWRFFAHSFGGAFLFVSVLIA
jgi:hypothetical protein